MPLLATLKFVSEHMLNQHQRRSALFRFMRWQLATRMLPFPVCVPFVNDYCLVLERGMTGATGNYYCGLHEPEDMGFTLHYLQGSDRMFDVGANIGSYALLGAAAGVASIDCFEPSTLAAGRLERNIRLNGLAERVRIHRVAVGDMDGMAQFTAGSDATNHVAVEADRGRAVEHVSMRTLDGYADTSCPTFLKIDVEGYEARVLAGATRMLSNPELRCVIVEENGRGRRYGVKGEVVEILLRNGFDKYSYDPRDRILSPLSSNRSGTGNLIFLRDADDALLRVRSAPRFRLINGAI